VDRIQHGRNLQIADLPRVRFRFGGAEAIDLPDGAADIVLMFKSLHHVPIELMDRALDEIRRVLGPGGLAYISEPIYGGEFNQLLRMFHDERVTRQAAFDAVRRAVERGALELVQQVFFLAPSRFADFADFERRIIHVTHTDHRIAPQVYARLRQRFEAAMTPDGAEFMQPHRVDLLRRPG
jgi:SAM-dependent methyltransferase